MAGSDPNRIIPDRVYSQPATEVWTGLSGRTLERKRSDGTGPDYVRLGPGRIGYRGSAILAWLKKNTFRSTAAELAAGRKSDGRSRWRRSVASAAPIDAAE